MINEIKSHKHQSTENKPCHYCEHVQLKEIRYPIAKVNKLFMEEFLDMKYNRVIEDEEKEKENEEYTNALKDYVCEIDRREIINRKFQKLKMQ